MKRLVLFSSLLLLLSVHSSFGQSPVPCSQAPNGSILVSDNTQPSGFSCATTASIDIYGSLIESAAPRADQYGQIIISSGFPAIDFLDITSDYSDNSYRMQIKKSYY